MTPRHVCAALLLVAAALLAAPAMPAGASCIAPPSIEESLESADLVFVGTTVELNNRNRWATFRVEEIWKGEPGGPRIDVRGGPPSGQATSVDRAFDIDTRYLVFATKGARHWEDNACSATQEYDASLDQFRPASTRTVTTTTPPSEADEGLKSGTVVFAGVMVVVVAGGYLVVRRWGRNTRTSTP